MPSLFKHQALSVGAGLPPCKLEGITGRDALILSAEVYILRRRSHPGFNPMIRTLGFDGYRSFPCRRQYDRSQPFQRLDLAPLTLLIGRNNAGKSSIAALLHQVLAGLAGINSEALPLDVGGHAVAESFQDLLHARDANTFLELDIGLNTVSGEHRLNTILYLHSLLDEDLRPWARLMEWDGQAYPIPEGPLECCLIPNVPHQNEIQAEATRTLRDSVWLGPLREPLPETARHVNRDPQEQMIRLSGAGIITFLAENETLFKALSSWLHEHAGFSLRWEKNLDLWRLKVVRGNAQSISITQVGAGVHQLLPVLTLALYRKMQGETTPYLDVVQQPELHLHDALQPVLGDLFIDCALRKRGVTVVETHAEGLLLRVRRRIAEGRLSPDLVALYYVDDAPKGSELRRIGLRENGDVDDWPQGVFFESFAEVKALRTAQRKGHRAILD
ncbi:hypothetical protein KKB55_02125 [Myxococcota bacterium]|nr:hypothetical protein [Myxococcota bacterium]MBU1896550.1 hypothetical protein [Myxococcota bacterium]